MKRSLIAVVVLAMIFAVSTTVSFAYKGFDKKPAGHYQKLEDKAMSKAYMILKNKDALGLTDEQVKQVKDLKLKLKKDEIAQNAEIETVALDIKSQLWEDTINTEAINALIDKKYELKKAKAKSSVAAYAQLKNILSQAQRDKLKELYKKCETKKGKSYH